MRFLLFFLFSWVSATAIAQVSQQQISDRSDTKKITVGSIMPDYSASIFWRLVDELTEVVAKDLGVQVTFYRGVRGRFELLDAIDRLLAEKKHPDYLIVHLYHGNEKAILERLEKTNIKVITVEDSAHGKTAERIGRPTQIFKNWIDDIVYDNRQGSQQVINELRAVHQQRYPNTEIQVVGLGGNYNAIATARAQGVIDLHQQAQISLKQILPTDWKVYQAKQKLPRIIKRYPQAKVIWAANGKLALAAIEVLGEKHDYIVGGFDWYPEIIESIQQGQMIASAGGHSLMGAQAILRIVQHSRGLHLVTPKYQLEMINKTNAALYAEIMAKKMWRNLSYTGYLASEDNPSPPVLSFAEIARQYRLIAERNMK